ncbi:hypothetical protein ABL850_15705 [Variovorax paradoxus]|uniref:hypothetical protein n=1 Tax=Variovorax paradoxus TaxID=34073 RepID=UPI0004028028
MTPIQKLVYRQRAHLILAEGLGIEICMALGDRDGAHRHRREMEAQIAARDAAILQAEEEGESYFEAAGAVARIQAEARRAA